ncbi:hypothetical protein WME75_23765 [Sorangium sp. So ce1014]|uniref:hypothetical protein n=1 Tax=Sorangium sp. So ce1014 TaxID=3133326 RepID=UPI003F622BB9
MSALGVAELADRTLLEPGGWSVVVVEEARIDATTRMLEEELIFGIEEEGVGSVRVFSERYTAPALVEALACMTPEDVALLPLSADVIVPVSRALDYERARLSGRPRGVIITSEAGLRLLAAEAPSLWSWVGPRVWHIDPLAGQLDVEARLSSLRQGRGLTDAEVLQRAEAGTLTLDPVFAEWLVLLGRGELLGR